MKNTLISFAKTCLFVLVTILFVTCNTKTIRYDWKPPAYQTVKAYLLPPELSEAAMTMGMTNDPNGFFVKIKREKGIELSEEQTKEIGTLFTSRIDEDTEYGPADCFNPRHAIVYYDTKGKPVAAIAACFECSALRAFPETKMPLHIYLKNFRPFFIDLGMPVFDNPKEYQTYMDSLKNPKSSK